MSIDYLLDHDIENISYKDLSITFDAIKSYVKRFNNNFDLFIWCADHLLSFEIEKNQILLW